MLFAGRQYAGSPLPKPVGIITVGTPDCACSLSESEKNEFRKRGYLESPSARTGQTLRVDLSWLTEQEADLDAHDVLGNVGRIVAPILVIHGENDETIDVSNAPSIASAAKNARVARINNCNHVLNTPNPPPTDFRLIPQLTQAIDEIVKFSQDCCVAQ